MLSKEPNLFAQVRFVYSHPPKCWYTDNSVEAKEMQFSYSIEDMFRIHLPKLKHGNDGLIFTSLEGEYVCGTDPYM